MWWRHGNAAGGGIARSRRRLEGSAVEASGWQLAAGKCAGGAWCGAAAARDAGSRQHMAAARCCGQPRSCAGGTANNAATTAGAASAAGAWQTRTAAHSALTACHPAAAPVPPACRWTWSPAACLRPASTTWAKQLLKTRGGCRHTSGSRPRGVGARAPARRAAVSPVRAQPRRARVRGFRYLQPGGAQQGNWNVAGGALVCSRERWSVQCRGGGSLGGRLASG